MFVKVAQQRARALLSHGGAHVTSRTRLSSLSAPPRAAAAPVCRHGERRRHETVRPARSVSVGHRKRAEKGTNAPFGL